ncbi:uncharacterized protein LOC116417319 isoform X2 [Nasonia vitripennis]|uniref:Uncharacterized protein n=1 Tax=Nasonia vitripennis TaxID=7425 RepID=A0A7M7R5J2_NASVI|nr:uncharacterized protein LOC116417319 isoform X2 [Nasonia vitripennis]
MEDESDKQFLLDQTALQRNETLSSSTSTTYTDTSKPSPMEVDYESRNIVKNEISVTIDQAKVVDASLKMQKDDSRSMVTKEDLHELLETESDLHYLKVHLL